MSRAERKRKFADRKTRQIEDRLRRLTEELESLRGDAESITDSIEDDEARERIATLAAGTLPELRRAAREAELQARAANMEIHSCEDHARGPIPGTTDFECERCGERVPESALA